MQKLPALKAMIFEMLPEYVPSLSTRIPAPIGGDEPHMGREKEKQWAVQNL